MLVMMNENVVYSTLYGLEGQKELRNLRKRFRQGQEVVVFEGDPVKEHLRVVPAKLPTLRQIAQAITWQEFDEMQAAKHARLDFNLAAPPPQPKPIVEEVDDRQQFRKPRRRPRIPEE